MTGKIETSTKTGPEAKTTKTSMTGAAAKSKPALGGEELNDEQLDQAVGGVSEPRSFIIIC